MTRVFSGIQPTGDPHLGSLLGALQHWVTDQHEHDSIYCVVDLHALTVPQDRGELSRNTTDLFRSLLAVGLDPDVATIFVQSHVHEHAELAWMMQCTASFGELRRMTQFKEKSEKSEFVSAGLLTYPALQAADILLYDADRVPVGDDQRQHIEITRDIAARFNSRYGETFVLPEAATPAAGARVMDLQNPENKMSKSDSESAGLIGIYDDPKVVEKRIKRAVTDSDPEVRYDPATKPGVSNLLSILGAVTGKAPADVAEDYEQYGALKTATAEAVIELLAPIQARAAELDEDPAELQRLIAKGAEKARATASKVLARARTNIGLLPRG